MLSRKPYVSYATRIAFFVLALGSLCFCQASKPSADEVITVGQPEALTGRAAKIAAVMDFSSKQASAFWPIYQQYERERSGLDSCRTSVVEGYGDKFLTMSNDEAKAMANRMFDCDFRLIALKKRYFAKFNKVLPAYTVAKFFQLDNRIDYLESTKLQSTLLPPMRSKSPDAK